MRSSGITPGIPSRILPDISFVTATGFFARNNLRFFPTNVQCYLLTGVSLKNPPGILLVIPSVFFCAISAPDKISGSRITDGISRTDGGK